MFNNLFVIVIVIVIAPENESRVSRQRGHVLLITCLNHVFCFYFRPSYTIMAVALHEANPGHHYQVTRTLTLKRTLKRTLTRTLITGTDN